MTFRNFISSEGLMMLVGILGAIGCIGKGEYWVSVYPIALVILAFEVMFLKEKLYGD